MWVGQVQGSIKNVNIKIYTKNADSPRVPWTFLCDQSLATLVDFHWKTEAAKLLQETTSKRKPLKSWLSLVCLTHCSINLANIKSLKNLLKSKNFGRINTFFLLLCLVSCMKTCKRKSDFINSFCKYEICFKMWNKNYQISRIKIECVDGARRKSEWPRMSFDFSIQQIQISPQSKPVKSDLKTKQVIQEKYENISNVLWFY